GAAILKQPSYPAYRPLTEGPLPIPKIAASNTTDFMLRNGVRFLALQGGKEEPEVFWTSSDGVAELLLKRQYDIGFMSVPLSSPEEAEVYPQHGSPVVELQCAT